jgi:periplasmic divalent cation tolerance protein
VVLSTFPDAETAARIARVLVEERLAACANLVPTVRSIYRWKDAIQDDAETLAIIKTTADRYAALAARIAELHPYEVPEILALPLAGGHPPYLGLARRSDLTEGASPRPSPGSGASPDHPHTAGCDRRAAGIYPLSAP